MAHDTTRLSRRSFMRTTGLGGGVLALAPLMAEAGETAGSADETYDFDTAYDRLGSDCIKWDAVKRDLHMDRIVAGMGIADMDFRAPPLIAQALVKRIGRENWGYLDWDGPGPKAFVEAIIAWNERHYGINAMNPGNVGIATGVDGALKIALRAFAPPGSKVLLTTPIYDGFYEVIKGSRLSANESLMVWTNGRYDIDWDDFERRMTPDTKVSILCNPHNPTGRVWSRDELNRYGELCLKHGVTVLADEIHCDFMSKGSRYTPFSSLEDKAIVANSITFKSGSKSFSLAAMKCAWFFSTSAKLYNELSFWNYDADINTLGTIAEHAALSGGDDWLRQCVAYIDANHDFARQYIKANIPLIKIGQKPEGTYLTWLDVSAIAERIGAKSLAETENAKPQPMDILTGRPTRITPEDMVQQWLATNAHVALNPGTFYGLGGQDHMRMNIATSRKTLNAALDSMASALKGLA